MKTKVEGEVDHLAVWKGTWGRLGTILVLLLLVLALNGPRLLSRAWGNIGMVALAQTLVAEPDEPPRQELGQAESLLRRAATYAPGNRSAWRGLGLALIAQGREEEALAAWQTAGRMPEEFVQRGERSRKLGQYGEALEWYMRAVTLDPGWGRPWYHMGLMYEDMAAWDEALEAFHQAEILADSIQELSGSLYFHLGQLQHKHMEPPDLPAALSSYQAAVAADRFSQDWERIYAHYERGDVLRRMGRMPEAMQEFRWVVGDQPNHYWGRAWLGASIWQVDGDLGEAEKHLKQAMALNPEEKGAYLLLGQIYQEAGRSAEAADVYQRVLTIDPENKAALQFFAQQRSKTN